MNIPPEQLQEIDLPEVMETFSDSLGVSSLDSQSARLTFCVRRMQPPKQGKPPLFKQYPGL